MHFTWCKYFKNVHKWPLSEFVGLLMIINTGCNWNNEMWILQCCKRMCY